MTFSDFMLAGGWALFSLVAAVFLAGFFLVNQYLRQPGHLIVFWMRVLVVLFLSPLVAQLDLPTDPKFYGAVLLTVFAGTFADIRTFNASAKYGGGVVSRVQPVTVWSAFLLWFAFDPHLLAEYAAHPINTAGIIAALFGCVFFSMRLNKCEITRAAMIDMAPALVGYTITTVLNKYAMNHGPLEGAVYGYMYFQSVLAAVIIGIYSLWRGNFPADAKTTGWVSKKMLAATILAALTWLCHMIWKNYAMAFTPNPSYQSALLLTAPVFISIFYHFAKHKEEADVSSGMGVVFCAVLLAVMTVH